MKCFILLLNRTSNRILLLVQLHFGLYILLSIKRDRASKASGVFKKDKTIL
nr:MAG TPA: hypothetical protein [Bacteriophage sp.]